MFTDSFLAAIATAVALTTTMTEAIKTKLHLTGIGAWVLSVVCGIICALIHGMSSGMDWFSILIFAAATVGSANGLFRLAKKTAK